MWSRSHLLTVLLIPGLAFTCASCDRRQTPTGPTGPTTPPSPAAVVRLEIGAPLRVAPGESVQLSATLIRSDGSREDATERVGWSVDSPVLQLARTGQATGVTAGEARVTGVFGQFSAQAIVLVLPPATFRLIGTVTHDAFGIGGADVTVASSAGTLTTMTTGDGRFAVYGVVGQTTLHVKKHGYFNRWDALDVGDHTVADVELQPDLSTTSGVYLVTISAGPCDASAETLPAELLRRMYVAHVVEEPGARGLLTVTLSGAEFVIVNGNGNRFSGFRDDQDRTRITFLEPDEEWGPHEYPLLERIGPDAALAIVGEVDTTYSGTAIEGRLRGSFRLIRNPPHGPVVGRCDSTAHDFEMRRSNHAR